MFWWALAGFNECCCNGPGGDRQGFQPVDTPGELGALVCFVYILSAKYAVREGGEACDYTAQFSRPL